MKWETTKIFAWVCLVVVAMIGMNNIDSLFSAFLQYKTCQTSMVAQSLLITNSAPSVLYHASVLMIILSMLLMSLLYINEIHKVKE